MRQTKIKNEKVAKLGDRGRFATEITIFPELNAFRKFLFRNGDLTLALAGRWRPLRVGAGRGKSGRAPG
jgi:hypothetical protein